MADDDNFDIDIYGDDTSPEFQENAQTGSEVKQEQTTNEVPIDSHYEETAHTNGAVNVDTSEDLQAQHESNHVEATEGESQEDSGTQHISSTGGSAANDVQMPKQAPRQQGMKRKQGDDDRPTDPGASSALLINDLQWWINEEDVRGWANQSGCEDELIDVTFNEHKVNGKSKGQVYVQLQSPQAATALKHQLDSYYKDQQHTKKPSAVFNPAHINPFKTLPKDVPARDKNRNDRSTGNFGGNQGTGHNFNQGNRFGNRGNFNNRGGQNNQMGFQNRNFSGPAGGNMGVGGYGNNNMGGFGSGAMGGGINNFGNFNRGGMMGSGMRGGMNNRGGRGGMMNNMGGMGGMGGNMMGNMGGMGMGMGGMGGNMGMMGGMGGPGGFGGGGGAQPHFNPAFFNQNQGGGDGNWNPHGAKRPRPE